MLGTALCEPQSYPIPLLSGEGGIENEITEVVWLLMSHFRLAEWRALPSTPLAYIYWTKERYELSALFNRYFHWASCHLYSWGTTHFGVKNCMCFSSAWPPHFLKSYSSGHYKNEHCPTKTSELITDRTKFFRQHSEDEKGDNSDEPKFASTNSA